MKNVIRNLGILSTFAALLTISACSDSERQIHSRGFHLPNGDFELGKEIFVSFKCHECHTVYGVDLPDRSPSKTQAKPVEIGGKVRKIRSYGELVASIIDPDHVVSPAYLATLSEEERKEKSGRSPMPAVNEDMTVQQLVDLAAFLFTTYQKNEVELEYYDYLYFP